MATYTAEEKQAWKEERMTEQREMLENALTELTSSAMWENWIKFGRSNLRKYSFNNACLVFTQFPKACLVRGRKQWEKQKVAVDVEAKNIRIFAPCFVPVKDANGNQMYDKKTKKPLKKVGFYKVVSVFDVSETDAPEVEFDPMVPVEGDDLAHCIRPLEQFAMELGLHVVYKDDTGSDLGWHDERMSQIVVKNGLSANATVRILIHELCHAYGNVNYQDYSREDAEVIVESSTIMALSMVGFDVSAASVPYIATWGGDLKTLDRNARLVEELVKTLTEKMGV